MKDIDLYNMTISNKLGKVNSDHRNRKIISSFQDFIDLDLIKSVHSQGQVKDYIQNLESKIHAITDAVKDPIIIIDNDGFISFWNRAAEQMFGYKSSEIIKKDLHKIIIPERFREASKKGFQMFKNSGKGGAIGRTLELAAVRKNGEEFPIELSLSAFETNGKWQAVGTVRDITEKKKEKDARIERERRLLDSFESSPIGFFRTTIAGKFLYANTFLLHMLGYRNIQELQSLSNITSIFIDPKDRDIYKKILLEEGVIYDYGFRLLKKDGTEVQVIGSSRIVNDQEGNALYFEGIMRDVTNERAKEKSNKKLLRAIEQSNASIIITDSDGIIEYVNPKFEKLTGYKDQEVIGKTPAIIKSGEMSQQTYEELWQTIKEGKDWHGEFYNKKKNGELFWESAIISPIKDEFGNIINFVAVKEDITEKKKTLQDLINAKEKSEESDRLKSTFISQMSHEIRTPLNVILGYLELIKDDLTDYPDLNIDQNVKIISEESKRLTRTFDSIINYSEVCATKCKCKLDIKTHNLSNDLLKEISNNFSDTAKSKNLDFTISAYDNEINVLCDKYSTLQILSHLVDNAIKFTDKGSVSIIATKSELGVLVRIKDTGIGISEDYQRHLFTPFTQERQGYTRKYDGNGLGLVLVKEYCELNNIDIKINSKKNIGTIVELKFSNKANGNYESH